MSTKYGLMVKLSGNTSLFEYNSRTEAEDALNIKLREIMSPYPTLKDIEDHVGRDYFLDYINKAWSSLTGTSKTWELQIVEINNS